jgi:hypothetical protein
LFVYGRDKHTFCFHFFESSFLETQENTNFFEERLENLKKKVEERKQYSIVGRRRKHKNFNRRKDKRIDIFSFWIA